VFACLLIPTYVARLTDIVQIMWGYKIWLIYEI